MVWSSRRLGVNLNINSSRTKIVARGPNGDAYSRVINIGGDAIDDAIARHVEEKYGLRIGNLTAETIRQELGLSRPFEPSRSMDVRARRVRDNNLETVYITSDDVSVALKDIVTEITEAVVVAAKNVLTGNPTKNIPAGITLEGKFPRNMDRLLVSATGLPTNVAAGLVPRKNRGLLDHVLSYIHR